ncbi:hypothetical protein LPJ59_000495 [Coemansia sp. RSA 2399]|nr:hypothetical protein LPJ59_000495 [Coemansia sp. RSA 2399]
MPFATTDSQERDYRPGTLRDTRAFARLSHFIWVFQEPLKIEDVDLGRLENELCDLPSEADEESNAPILMQAIKRSLRILTGNRNIEEKKMDTHISRAWDKYMEPCGKRLPPDYEQLGLFGLGAGDRTHIALDTCELVFCRPDNLRSIGTVASKLAEDPVQWRTEPLGTDSLGRKYYLLCESRLYRETPKLIADLLLGLPEKGDETVDEEQQVPEQPEEASRRRRSTRLVASAKEADEKKKKAAAAEEAEAASEESDLPVPSMEDLEFADPAQHRMREDDGDLWELVCSSVREWNEYPKVFCRSRKKNEKALYKTLMEVATPIVQKLNSAARLQQKQEALAQRKRSSRIALRRLLHDEAEVEARVYNGSYSSGYSSSMDGDYVPGTRRSKRLRSTQPDGLSAAPGQRIVEGRDVRAQRREEARRAALDSTEAANAVRQVAEVAEVVVMVDSSRQSEGYGAAVESDVKKEEASVLNDDESEYESEGQSDAAGDGDGDGGGGGGGDEWMFNCSCGKTGHNYDDGRTMTACEKCSVWRHLGCALRAEAQRIGENIHEDDWESMHYVCPNCRHANEREAMPSAPKPAADPPLPPPPPLPDHHIVAPSSSFGHVPSKSVDS